MFRIILGLTVMLLTSQSFGASRAQQIGWGLCAEIAQRNRVESACKNDVLTRYSQMDSIQMALYLCTEYSASGSPDAACFRSTAANLNVDRRITQLCEELGTNRAIGDCYRQYFVRLNSSAASSTSRTQGSQKSSYSVH